MNLDLEIHHQSNDLLICVDLIFQIFSKLQVSVPRKHKYNQPISSISLVKRYNNY